MEFTVSPGPGLLGCLILLAGVAGIFLAACILYFLLCAHRITVATQKLACVAEDWLAWQKTGGNCVPAQAPVEE